MLADLLTRASIFGVHEGADDQMTVHEESADAVGELPDHLFRWLDATTRRLREEMFAQIDPEDLAVRGSPARLLLMIPPAGMRISDLAERAYMTKQALGQLANQLEERGLVESHADPTDGRVRLVRRTEAGRLACAVTEEKIAAAEDALRQAVGAARYDEMKQVLRELSGTRT